MTSPPPPSGGPLVGRTSEAARIRRFAGPPGEGGPVLVVTGDPGIGKSALVGREAGALREAGFRILRAEGCETERELAFAGLHQLLRPVLTQAQMLPDRQRDALLSAFGITAGPGEPDPLVLRVAVLTLLSHEARSRPVLLVVDDAQWLDGDSLDVLAFVARRLEGERISVLGVVRGGSAPPAFAMGRPVLELGPFDADAAGLLLDAQPHRPGGPLRARILHEAAGNPLALIEFARAEGGPAPWPVEPLPLTERLEQCFTGRLDALPPATRQALLLAATDEDAVAGLPPQVWRPAERAGLICVRDDTVRFRHPLIRSAVYQAAPLTQRRAAHRRCAATLRDAPDRRAWHLAAGGTGPSEATAREIERSARETGKRGGFASAALALQRAADLSPDRHERARRLTLAARLAVPTGQTAWVEELTDRVRTLSEDPVLLALATLYRGQALALTPRRGAAYPLLTRTARELAPHHPGKALQALATAALICYYQGDAGLRDELRGEFFRLGGHIGRRPEPDLASLWIRTATDPCSDRAGLLAGVRRLAGMDAAGPELTAATATLAWLLDETGLAMGLFDKVGGSASTPSPLPEGLRCVEGWVCLDHGRWDRAAAVAAASARAAAESDPPYTAAAPPALDAAVLALRGETGAARAAALRALDAVAAPENRFVAVRARWALGMAAMADGDHAAAFDQFREMFTAGGDEVHYRESRYGLADLAAAAVRVGRHEGARGIVDRLADRMADASPRQRALLSRARALLADGDGAERHFRAALDEPSTGERPFSHAQTQLEYGEWLRRRLRSGRARPLLTAALETFVRLGAEPWAGRARAELRAAGIRQSVGVPERLPALTPQQRQIVRLAARGLTNREIGARLQLSPRTVGSHLYRSFPKLGVTARSQLRDVIDGRPAVAGRFALVEGGSGEESGSAPQQHSA
ncbi:AAA family ATPase [Streptomyces bungoensis]|uniref:AAA family ATPase n=1 Tax=Streptomyces bungoensis TaxID=285568 RepID=UPI0034098329